jgi:tRNA U55 pseudouridine synthase TruB
MLGCGGHLNALKRIASSGFTLDQAVSLSAVKNLAPGARRPENFISMADALPEMPACAADTHLLKKIRHGQKITARDLTGAGGLDAGRIAGSKIKVVDQTGELVAILNYQEHDQQLNYCCVFAKQDA